jgi:hypothetical protein
MSAVNVYRDGKVHVRASQCDHCLLSKDRLVDGERARDIIRETRERDGGSFICHRNQVSDEPEAICATWFERFGDEDPVLRVAAAMGVIEYVKTETEGTPHD